jgi:hypothetical protein
MQGRKVCTGDPHDCRFRGTAVGQLDPKSDCITTGLPEAVAFAIRSVAAG